MKREAIETATSRVVSACLLAGSSVSAAYTVAADFAKALERGESPEQLVNAKTEPPTSTRVEDRDGA